MDIPVNAFITAAPPKMSIADTTMLVRKQKKKNTCRELKLRLNKIL